ncbi:hypothetical protein [Halosimplex carlsbadense]|uniref:hypothetical protein n=1 Tax=Halosimplex carlsbadense TaxID=171164 RepID=UPI001268E0AE|nr:hypothetical protein [Halosimplex carlsbadense]
MKRTPNHQYNVPEEGAKDWHVALNENFERIDEGVEIRDTEANKGDYDPRDGAKYEATDSGAVYLGNGNSWVLANRRVKSFQAESVNNVRTPSDTDIESFRTVAEGGGVIRLKPGATYEWDETFTFDPESNETLRVIAHGATIDHSSDPAVDIHTSNPEAIESTPSRFVWRGGEFVGPGQSGDSSVSGLSVPDHAPDVNDGSAHFRLLASSFHTIFVESSEQVRASIYVKNQRQNGDSGWSEGNKLGVSRGHARIRDQSVDFFLLAVGSQYVSGDAGGSMRNIQIEYPWGSGRGATATIYQGGANWQGGKLEFRGNLPPGGWGWWSDGGNDGMDIHWESEFGDSESTDIEFAGNNAVPPVFTARITNPDAGIINGRPGNIFVRRIGGGIRSPDGKKGFQIESGNDRWTFQSNTLIDAGSYSTNTPVNLANRDGNKHTQMRYHNGSDGSPPGWYWWDANGDESKETWIMMGNNSVKI